MEPTDPNDVWDGELQLRLPEASGSQVFEDSGAVIDASNTEDGYVMIKCTSEKRLKVRVLKEDSGYNYDLNGTGQYEVFPLQMGNGEYEVRVMEQVEGTTYAPLCRAQFSVTLKNENIVFVYPNQYVWYTNATKAVEKSFALCKNAQSDREKLEILFQFVVSSLQYDEEKAKTVQSGYLPNVDEVLASGKGICFDYAALLGAMLRAQDIPVTLVIGNVMPENILHAWNQVYIDGKWVWYDATLYGTGHKETDYTQERRY